MSDKIILVGGSKDGVETDGAVGLNSVQNIVLNDDFTGPEYVDRYVATGVQDREGREVYAHVGRYNAEESQSYWESLPQDQVEAFIEAEKAERAEAEAAAAKAEEEAAVEEKTEETVVEETTVETPEAETVETTETVTTETTFENVGNAEQVATQDAETGEVTQESASDSSSEA